MGLVILTLTVRRTDLILSFKGALCAKDEDASRQGNDDHIMTVVIIVNLRTGGSDLEYNP